MSGGKSEVGDMGRTLAGSKPVGASVPSLRKFFNRFKREELIDVAGTLVAPSAIDVVRIPCLCPPQLGHPFL